MWKSRIYPKALPNFFGGTGGDGDHTDWISDTIKVAILVATYTPSSSHEFWSDVSGHEISVSGYSSGGISIGSKTVTYDSTYRLVTLDGANAHVSADVDNGDARYGIVYNDSASNKPLIGYIDFGSIIDDNNTNSGDQYGFHWNDFANALFSFSTRTAGAVSWYGKALANAFGGETGGEDRRTNFTVDTIKVGLLDDGHTPDIHSHEVWSDVSGDEVSGSGYAAGGITVSGQVLSLSGKVLTLDFNDPFWSNVTLTNVRYAVAYNDTSTDKPLLWLFDLLANQSPSAESLLISMPAAGVARLTAA